MNRILLLTFCLLLSSINAVELYKLVKHPKDRGAMCLDGSALGTYIHEGKGKNKDKFLIHFCGGGHCGDDTLNETVDNCYNRSFTMFGTSTIYPPFFDFDDFGVLSTNKDKNPVFWDWTKVFAMYCDGGVHQGSRSDPISYKGKSLYFRGSKNAREQFYYLDKQFDFYNKDTIVVSGLSAGGVATYYWVDYVQNRTNTSKVYGIPDSGMFMSDFNTPILGKQYFLNRFLNLQKLVGTPDDNDDIPPPV